MTTEPFETIGKVRWIFNLTPKCAAEMARKLGARIKTSIVPDFQGSIYSYETLNEILEDLCSRKINNADLFGQEPPFTANGQPDGFEELWYWAVSSSEADELLRSAFAQIREQYSDYPFQAGPLTDSIFSKAGFYKKRHVWAVICGALLDTSEINLRQAVLYLITQGFSVPDRQRLEARPDFVVGWDEFQKLCEPPSCAELWKQKVLPHVGDGSHRHKAALLAIEKCSGKTHEQAFETSFPGKHIENPRKAVSTYRSAAEDLAKEFDVPMPSWDSRR